MCGNFGLLTINRAIDDASTSFNRVFKKKIKMQDELDESLDSSMHTVAALGGIRLKEDSSLRICFGNMLPSLKILQFQTSCTEIRGGQAGGISCIEKLHSSPAIYASRVRAVARKRYPLAADLARKFEASRASPSTGGKSEYATYIGHTRFATSSVNVEAELHPHQWEPMHTEIVWQFDLQSGQFEKTSKLVGVHISHNGDFDVLNAYSQKMVVGEVGLWLERVLHCSNDLKGDSPKVAGCMDLLRVQGRWAAAARLAWVRILHSPNDVCGGSTLAKNATNTFPKPEYFQLWAEFFDYIWVLYKKRIVKQGRPLEYKFGSYTYALKTDVINEFKLSLFNELYSIRNDKSTGSNGDITFRLSDQLSIRSKISETDSLRVRLGIEGWTSSKTKSFLSHAVRGFLRYDLYNAATEFLSRAEGSFGLQIHSPLEPGVVVIASKGQPMSFSFHPNLPIVLYGSEAEAVAVPVDEDGNWLPERIDLDSNGEVVRIGPQRGLDEGSFKTSTTSQKVDTTEMHLTLESGLEIQSYSLVTCTEAKREDLIARAITIIAAPIPYDPKKDLVQADLRVIPGVLAGINRAWSSKLSLEWIASDSLATQLIDCMANRLANNLDTTDLLIAGVEASLWVAEQFASDLKVVFPQLNVVTISTNKLLGLGSDHIDKVHFPGADEVLPRRLDSSTCALLISQSGQTFPSLHATRKLSELVSNRLWLLTGCFNSKMELAMTESYKKQGLCYGRNRVINNYSGNRPAEPTSVAIVATMHTLTRLLIHLLRYIKASAITSHGSFLIKTDSGNCTPFLNEYDQKMLSALEPSITVAVSDDSIRDFSNLVDSAVIPDLAAIVGYNVKGYPIENSAIHDLLVNQGLTWAAHITEYWRMLVYVFFYILISVGAGMPIFCMIGDAIAAIVLAAHPEISKGKLAFSPRNYYYSGETQDTIWTLLGALLQIADAIFFIFLCKIFTWFDRLVSGRPLFARHGKRTIVIVDTPCVHQLVESFVSKLFSQSYSFVSVDVHGASGLDHFVHRFTHRVVRGVLLAVGRPDGRLGCLSKSEASILLSTKQAVFIRNPAYKGEGSGPDIFTVGHNPFKPNLGAFNSIVLPSSNREKFVNEYIFESLALDTSVGDPREKASVLFRKLSKQFQEQKLLDSTNGTPSEDFQTREVLLDKSISSKLPIGIHHIRIEIVSAYDYATIPEKVVNETHNTSAFKTDNSYNDPAFRSAFASRMDEVFKETQIHSKYIEYLYESRIAALERYVAFCIIFHAMAKKCSSPWFRTPWDIGRSQSNLRVATTASPISALAELESRSISEKAKLVIKRFYLIFSKKQSSF